MSVFKYILIGFILFNTISCDYLNIKNKANNEDLVASVGDVDLYRSDLSHLFNSNTNNKDSLIKVNNFIESWARKQIIIQKATLNLSEDKQDELKKMLANYRDDLYMNTYKDALVSQNLDTLVDNSSILDFYNENKRIFRLKENIVQIKHYRFKTKGNTLSKIRNNYNKYTLKELDSIYEEDLNFSITQLSDTLWITLSDFVNRNSYFKTINNKKALRKGYFREIKENDFTHFIKIVSVKTRGEVAPQEYVSDIIKQMIIHKNKLKYINNLDNSLIEEAIQNNTFKRY